MPIVLSVFMAALPIKLYEFILNLFCGVYEHKNLILLFSLKFN